MTGRRIAVLIDGGFFLKRLPKLVQPGHCDRPERVATCVRWLCRNHVRYLTGDCGGLWQNNLHRIFYYDAVPYDGKAHHPIDNRPLDFGRSDVATFRRELFDILRRQRKVALRLGKVNKEADWTINPRLTKKLLRTRQAMAVLNVLGQEADLAGRVSDISLTLTPDQVRDLIRMRDLWLGLGSGEVSLGLKQKGVDMRIGVDIAQIALKRQADTIVLVAGDSDFVPAAKLARREGLEFILDPLWQDINDDLHEHIDALSSGFKRPSPAPVPATPPLADATS